MAKYYIIWVEGLNWKKGEKVRSISSFRGVKYTVWMMKTMRVKLEDISLVRNWLIEIGVAPSYITFVPTSYAPAGTVFLRDCC